MKKLTKKEKRETIKFIFAMIITIGGCYLAEFTSNWILSFIEK